MANTTNNPLPVNNTNIRIPPLQNPGDYPYVRFTQYRDGSWSRQDETPGFESHAKGHITGSFKETNANGAIKNLTVATKHEYVQAGGTATTELNTHEYVGNSTAHQIGADTHRENGGAKYHAIGAAGIQAYKGEFFLHSVAGVTHTSNGNLVTDFNDGSLHHNTNKDHVIYVGGVRYDYANTEYGIYVGNNHDVFVKNNLQHTSNTHKITTNTLIVTASQSLSTVNSNATSANALLGTAQSGQGLWAASLSGGTIASFATSSVQAYIDNSGFYHQVSDRNLKENIVDTGPKTETIMNIIVRDFNFIGKSNTVTGLIAQELNKIYPQAVTEGEPTEGEPWTIKYDALIPILIKTIQELNKRIETLEGKS